MLCVTGHMSKYLTTMMMMMMVVVIKIIKKHAVCLKILSWFQANGLAAKGQYQAGSVLGQAADQGLFIKDHNY